MATTTTTTDPDPVSFPFTGLPGLRVLEQSPIPRGFVSFENSSVTIAVAGAGEDQTWRINFILPIGYAYILTEVHIQLQGAIAEMADWDEVMNGELNWQAGPRAIPFDGVSLGDTMATTTLDRRVYTFSDLPKTIMVVDDAASQAGFRIGNHTVDGLAMSGSVFGRFLQFDIEQAHNWEVHTPQLIR